MGLLALMLLHESRRDARTSDDGELVLLDEQDRSLWDRAQIAEGLALVERALRRGAFGPYTLQAAIAAVHAEARDGGGDRLARRSWGCTTCCCGSSRRRSSSSTARWPWRCATGRRRASR